MKNEASPSSDTPGLTISKEKLQPPRLIFDASPYDKELAQRFPLVVKVGLFANPEFNKKIMQIHAEKPIKKENKLLERLLALMDIVHGIRQFHPADVTNTQVASTVRILNGLILDLHKKIQELNNGQNYQFPRRDPNGNTQVVTLTITNDGAINESFVNVVVSVTPPPARATL